MTWDELRELHASGLVDVESHTYESRYVPEWPVPIPLDGVAPDSKRGSVTRRCRCSRTCGWPRRGSGAAPGKIVKHLVSRLRGHFPWSRGSSEMWL